MVTPDTMAAARDFEVCAFASILVIVLFFIFIHGRKIYFNFPLTDQLNSFVCLKQKSLDQKFNFTVADSL
jgi:hypothetical protein